MAKPNDKRRMAVNISDVDAIPGAVGYHLRNFDDRTYADARGTRVSSLEVERPVSYNLHGSAKLFDFIEYGSTEERLLEEFKQKLRTEGRAGLPDVFRVQRVIGYHRKPFNLDSSRGISAELPFHEEDFIGAPEREIDRAIAHHKNLARLF